MLAVEATKVIMARFSEKGVDVDVFALTFDYNQQNYKLLNEELKFKHFQEQDKNQVKVRHWSDFTKLFAVDHNDILTIDQITKLETGTESKIYKDGGEVFMSVLTTVAEVLNKSKRKVIVMIDEIDIACACKLK